MTTAAPPEFLSDYDLSDLSPEEFELLAGLPVEMLDDLISREYAEASVALLDGVPAERDARKAWAERSLLNFMRAYMPHYMKSPSAQFHYELCDIALDVALCRGDYAGLTGKKGFVGAAPREHAKSTLISTALPLYCALFRKKRFIIIFSDTDIPQAKGIAANIKAEIDENDLLRADFGDLKGESWGFKWSEQDFYIIHTEHGRVTFKTRVLSRGVGAKARGLRDRESRPDLIIGDDLENDDHVQTIEQRDKLELWFLRAVMPMLDHHIGRVLVVGTVLHTDSLLSRLMTMAKEPGSRFVTRLWRAITDDGEPLWPEVYTLDMLIQIRTEKPFAFATEYMNNPVDEQERIIRPENVQWYSVRDIDFNAQLHTWRYKGQRLRLFAFVDPAISEKEKADETAIVVAGVTADRKVMLVLFVFHARIDFVSQVGRVIQVGDHFQPARFGIETQVYQKALDEVTRKRLRASGVRVHPVKRSLRKYDRIKGMSPIFGFGIVHLRRAEDYEQGEWDELRQTRVHHSMRDFYDQLIYYPSTKHSDMVDAFEGVVNIAGGVTAFTPNTWMVL